jgi:hypothetical protein
MEAVSSIHLGFFHDESNHSAIMGCSLPAWADQDVRFGVVVPDQASENSYEGSFESGGSLVSMKSASGFRLRAVCKFLCCKKSEFRKAHSWTPHANRAKLVILHFAPITPVSQLSSSTDCPPGNYPKSSQGSCPPPTRRPGHWTGTHHLAPHHPDEALAPSSLKTKQVAIHSITSLKLQTNLWPTLSGRPEVTL